MRRKFIVHLAAAVTLLATIAACGSSSNEDEGDGSVPSTTIGVNRNILFLPVWVAQEQGFYADHGVEVELKEVGLGPELRTALLSQTLDMIVQSPEGSAILWEQGARVVNLVATQGHLSWELLLSKDLEGKVEPGNIDALKGLTINIVSKATGPDFMTQALLREHGLEPGKDVELVAVGSDNAARITALRQGEIDGSWFVEPGASLAKQEVGAFTFANLGEQKVFTGSDEMPMGAIAALGSWLDDKDNEDTARRVVEAIVDAEIYISENPDAAAKYAAELSNLDVEVARAIIDRQLVRNRPSISQAGWDTITKIMADGGGLEKRAPYDQVTATQFADVWQRYEDSTK